MAVRVAQREAGIEVTVDEGRLTDPAHTAALRLCMTAVPKRSYTPKRWKVISVVW